MDDNGTNSKYMGGLLGAIQKIRSSDSERWMDLKKAWEIEGNVPPGDDSGKIVALIRIIRIHESLFTAANAELDRLRGAVVTCAADLVRLPSDYDKHGGDRIEREAVVKIAMQLKDARDEGRR